jgi:hypothetical protein
MRKFCPWCAARQRHYEGPKQMFYQMIWVRDMTESGIAENLGLRQGSVSVLIKRFGVKSRPKGRRKIRL